jgi:excisionase family DNA binding protein
MNTAREKADSDASALATVREVADYLSLSRSKLYGLMYSGQLPYVKLGKCRRIRWADVASLIQQSTIGA